LPARRNRKSIAPFLCKAMQPSSIEDGRTRLGSEEANSHHVQEMSMFPTVRWLAVLSAFPLVLAAAPASLAADPPAKTAAAPATTAASTATFLTNTAVGNLFEIESSKLALAKSQSEKIKTFANKMVTDHTAAGGKFKQAVTDTKLTPPAEKLDAKHQAMLDDLKTKNGAAFDKAYIEAQYNGHVETVAMFEAYAKGGDNPRMKQFATDLLPTLKGHLDHVVKLK
jgi:putative membrane protein